MRGWSTSFPSLFKGKRGNTADIAKKKVMRWDASERCQAAGGSRRTGRREEDAKGGCRRDEEGEGQTAALQEGDCKGIQSLDDFEAQLKYTAKHQEVTMYIFGCSSCGSITMVNRQPFDEWHECPVCRNMINLPSLKSKAFKIVDTGEGWMEQLKELAKGE